MRVNVNQERAYFVLDQLCEMHRKGFPHKIPEEAVPLHSLVPEQVRKDRELLARYYFFICLYMRDRVKSHDVFRRFVRLWEQHPELFDLRAVNQMTVEEIQSRLFPLMGRGTTAASRGWLENASRALNNWGGSLHRHLCEIASYNEAVDLISNKSTKTRQKSRGHQTSHERAGFFGFREKMTSLLLYFLDTEGMLKRFPYPPPVDFRHYQIFLQTEAIVVESANGTPIRFNEHISSEIRQLLMDYLSTSPISPRELSDLIWFYGILWCSRSPATTIDQYGDMADPATWSRRLQIRFHETCGDCPLNTVCRWAIPARPYYRKGIISLHPRVPVSDVYRPPLQLKLPGL